MIHNIKKAEDIWEEVKDTQDPRKQFYYQMLCLKLSPTQSTMFLGQWERSGMESITRFFRKLAPEELKNRKMEKEVKTLFPIEDAGVAPTKDFSFTKTI